MRIHSALALFVGLALVSTASFADTRFYGKAVRVLDGDTIDVLTPANRSIRVRLANIDAPEKKQPFGQKSKQNLLALVGGKTVEVVDLGGDQYGRRIGRILVNGKEANTEQVRDGMAWVYTLYNQDDRLGAIETAARKKHMGLWIDPSPQAPWEYRHHQK